MRKNNLISTILASGSTAIISLAMAAQPAYADTGTGEEAAENSQQNDNQDTRALHQLLDDAWAAYLDDSPILAYSLGHEEYAGKLSDPSLSAIDARIKEVAQLRKRLDQINPDNLSEKDKVNFLYLKSTMDNQIALGSYDQRAINFTNYASWHNGFTGLHSDLPFKNADDYRIYLKLLAQYPAYNQAQIDTANYALSHKIVQPCDAIAGFEDTISSLWKAKPEDSGYYKPFAKDRPSTISAEDFAALQDEAKAIISGKIYPALQKHHDWFVKDYLPQCAKSPAASDQPNGAAYYQYLIAKHTTTNMTADEVHQIGLSEVARIRSEMVTVAKEAGYDSREAYIEHLRTDPQYYAKTPEELMEKTARITKFIDAQMPTLFHKLPRLPYGIKEIPANIAPRTTTAYYSSGSVKAEIAGTYFVNTSKLDQRPLWEIPALSMHEAVPGHHHQISLQQEMDLPDLRRYGPYFTAYVEGWGLYSEKLGLEFGLYDTPAKNMGRLSYEMWRACRLVVDTGIHAKGWSKEQAIAFMLDNSALSQANIEAEVNRYISWPGQALGYKIGEITIVKLRKEAEAALGDDFDLKAFNDAVLNVGAVPMDVLQQQIHAWIKAQQAA